ncbi:MAG: sulfatase-like hydrolase/transferase, partial [Planctomycetota bacterium]
QSTKEHGMTRHARLLLAALVTICTLVSSAEAKRGRSVLLMISDNQNFDDVGCYGNPVIQTPHLDRLAAEGVRFSRAFTTTASCGPSRGVIYTGLHVHRNGQYGHGHGYHNFGLLPKVQTVFSLLKADGYRTLSEKLVAFLERTGDPWLLRHELPRGK